MEGTIFSILLVLIGLFVGAIIVIVVNYIKGATMQKNVEKLLEHSKKEAEKIKRDSILEAKEEAHRLKKELDVEIKEKSRSEASRRKTFSS